MRLMGAVPPPIVGASLLAKNVNDNACFLNKRSACEFFASKLAPTVGPRDVRYIDIDCHAVIADKSAPTGDR